MFILLEILSGRTIYTLYTEIDTKTEIDTNIYTKSQIDTNIYTKIQIDDTFYTKTNTDTNFANIARTVNLETKTQDITRLFDVSNNSYLNIGGNVSVTGDLSCNSIFGVNANVFVDIPKVYRDVNQGRDFSFYGFLQDIYSYVDNTHTDALNGIDRGDEVYDLATGAMSTASGAVAGVGTVGTSLVVANGILTTTNGVVAGIGGAVTTLQGQVGSLETTTGTLSTKTAYMTTPTTPSIRTQFTSDLTVQNPVSMITTFSANMEDGSVKITNGGVCDLYSNELAFSDATNNQRSRLNMDGLLLYDSVTHSLTTSLSSDGAVNFYDNTSNSNVINNDGLTLYATNGTSNSLILDKTGLLIYGEGLLTTAKTTHLNNNGELLMYDSNGITPLIKMSVSNCMTFYNKLYMTFPIIEILSNLQNEGSIKLYNVFSILGIPYNRCTVSINNNGSIYFKSVGSNSNSYDTKLSTTNGSSSSNGQGALNMESINFNLNSTDITSTCNLTCNKLTTNSSDGLNQTILGGGATYIKLNPLQFSPVANDGSINISTVGAITLTASSINLNAPLVYGQTTTIISSFINQVW